MREFTWNELQCYECQNINDDDKMDNQITKAYTSIICHSEKDERKQDPIIKKGLELSPWMLITAKEVPNGKRLYRYSSWRKEYKLTQTLDSNHDYEIIVNNRPCHAYFDLEAMRTEDNLNNQKTIENAFEELKRCLHLVYEEYRSKNVKGWDFDWDDVRYVKLVSSYPNKDSWHVILHLPNDRMFNNNVQMGSFIAKCVNYSISKHGWTSCPFFATTTISHNIHGVKQIDKKPIFDTGVYTKNRIFRKPYHSKKGKDTVLAIHVDGQPILKRHCTESMFMAASVTFVPRDKLTGLPLTATVDVIPEEMPSYRKFMRKHVFVVEMLERQGKERDIDSAHLDEDVELFRRIQIENRPVLDQLAIERNGSKDEMYHKSKHVNDKAINQKRKLSKRPYGECELMFSGTCGSNSRASSTTLTITDASNSGIDNVFVKLTDAVKIAITTQTNIPCYLVRSSPHGTITLQASTPKNVICPYKGATHEHNHTWFSVWLSYPLPTIYHRCYSPVCADQQTCKGDMKKLVIDTEIFSEVIRLTEEFYLTKPLVSAVIIPSLLSKQSLTPQASL